MDCSKKARASTEAYQRLLLKYTPIDWSDSQQHKHVVRCNFCPTYLEKPKNMFMLPFDIYLCSSHNRDWFTRTFRQVTDSLSAEDRTQSKLLELINQRIVKREQHFATKNAAATKV